MSIQKILILALACSISGLAEDWRFGGTGPDGGKAYYDCDPSLVKIGSKTVVVLQHKYSFDGRFYAIFITYLRLSKFGWEYAPKSQIEYNWDGSLKDNHTTTDEELYWSKYTYERNEINLLRLARAKKLLKAKG